MLAIGQSASEPEPHRVRSKSLAIGADDLDARGRSPMGCQRARSIARRRSRRSLPRLHLSAAMYLKSRHRFRVRCQLSVGHGVPDVTVAPGRAGARGCRGQGVAAGLARHVDVDRKGHLARAQMRLMSRFTAAEVKGRPRSAANTNADSGAVRAGP